jgi:hypothetical protein
MTARVTPTLGKVGQALLIGLALLVASPCFGQSPSPFQSVPAPAPAPKPRPPRPAPRPDDYPPAPSAMPAPVVPTPPPAAPSLAGRWTGNVNCPLMSGALVVNATSTAPDQYTLTGTTTGQSISGSIAGKQVHFETHGLLASGVFQGSVTSPTTIIGTTVPMLIEAACNWSLNKN